jgi:hypothetical protein
VIQNPLLNAARVVRRSLHEVLAYLDLQLAGANEVARHTDFTRCPRPVLLLPGFLGTRRALEVMERRLRRDGYCVFSLNLGGLLGTFNTRPIEELALHVREKVERLYTRYDMGPLAIIGHSKGGLIGRYYIKRLGGHQRACALITLGTPHNGSSTAMLGTLLAGLWAPSVRQMTPMSRFIRRLKEGPFPDNVRFVSVYSKGDRVSSFPSGILETDGRPNMLNVDVNGIGHHQFLVKKRVYDVVRHHLQLAFDEAAHRTETPLEQAVRAVPATDDDEEAA